MSNNTQTARIFIQDPIHANALGDIYICEDSAQIAKNGHLFILVNLTKPQNDYEQFVGAFIEKCVNTYYYCVLEDTTKILEFTLNEINKWLPANLPANKKILSHLNIVIGNLKDNLINISLVGDWHSYLIHPLKANRLEKDQAVLNPIKLFNEIHQIQFTQNCSFIITNPSLLDYLSLDKVRKIVSTIPARSAAEQLRSMVTAVPTSVSFLSLILKSQDNSKTIEKIVHPDELPIHKPTIVPRTGFGASTASSRESLDQLISTQKQTQKIMTVPSSWQTLVSTWNNIKESLKGSKILPLIFRGITKLFVWLWLLLKLIARGLLFILVRIKRTIVSIIKPDHSGPQTRNRISFSWLTNINKNKLILGTIGLLILVLVIVLVWSNTSVPQLSGEELASINAEFTAKEEAIEAALIYGDRIRAQNLLEETITLLATLPVDKKNPDQYTGLQQRTNFLTERIWNIMTITEPVELFSLGNEIAGNFVNLTAKDDLVYAFTDQNQYLIYNFSDKGYQIVDYPSNFAGVQLSTLAPDNSILVIDHEKKFFIADDAGLQPNLISLSAGLQSITATSTFFNRLYILDGQTDQIYRHSMDNGVFRTPDLWLKDNIDLGNASDIAIDGFVYLLNGNEIIKLTNGRRQTFASIDLYPILNQPQKLYTNADLENIYLLESANNRIIILDKEGKLIKQYRSDEFTDLQDFAIQEEAKRIFIITNNKLYVIPI